MNEKLSNPRRSDTEWMKLIHECRTSGLGDKDWCEQHDIPISTFYTKVTRLRKKACEVPTANHRSIRETQQVVPLPIIDETDEMYENAAINEAAPVVVIKRNGYCIEISNHAARETIFNTLAVLQQLC